MRLRVNTSPRFMLLNNKTPMQCQLSDHNVVINNNLLFFNMLKPCSSRWDGTKISFNNGFAISHETQTRYHERIRLVVQLLAEAVTMNPKISIIGLAEAPVNYADIQCFINEFAKHPALTRFKKDLHPGLFTSMGVATIIDAESYSVVRNHDQTLPTSLNNRLQDFLLTSKNCKTRIRLVNLHLPFDKAKSKENTCLIEAVVNLFQQQSAIPVIVMGDFNIHPEIFAALLPKVAYYIQQPNNLLVKTDPLGNIDGHVLDTVDGILQSATLNGISLPSYTDASAVSGYGINPQKELSLLKSFIASKLALFKPLRKKLYEPKIYGNEINNGLAFRPNFYFQNG